MKKLSLWFMICILCLGVASAFDQEIIKEDITSFEWSFLQPWGVDKESYKEFWTAYVDNFGCKDVKIDLYYELDVLQKIEECNTVPPECTSEEIYDSKNDSYTMTETCVPQTNECSMVDKHSKELYDLEEGDYLIPENSRIIIKGNRKATSQGICDINFKYDDGIEDFDAKTGGILGLSSSPPRAWWNLTFQRRYAITANISGGETLSPFLITINSSYIDVNDCQTDFGDLRVVNSTDDEVAYNLSSIISGTSADVYVNASLNWTGFIYCNASSPVTTTSQPLSFGTLSDNLWGYFHMNGTADATDYSGEGNTLAERGAVPEVTGFTIADEKARGVFSSQNSFNLANTDFTTAQNFSMSSWVQHKGAGGQTTQNIFIAQSTACGVNGASAWQTYSDGVDSFRVYGGSAASCEANLDITLVAGAWYHVVTTWNTANNNLSIYVNGTKGTDCTAGSTSDTTSGCSAIGTIANAAFTQFADKLYIDEVIVWDDKYLVTEEVQTVFNDQLVFPLWVYGVPAVTYGSVELSFTDTNVAFGLYDSSWNDISNFTDEGEEFLVWANYTYDNSSAVYPDGWCNYTAADVISEEYQSTPGTNLTVCDGVCDSTNKTFTFTDLHTGGYQQDIFRFKLCKVGSNPIKSVTVSTNCSYSESIVYPVIPLCSVGYINLSLNSSACADSPDLTLSVWSDATSASKALVLVNTYGGVDRVHNASQSNMTWNATLGRFVSLPHEYYEHGSHIFYVDCMANVSGVENQTGSYVNITVANLPPTISISSIWDSISLYSAFVNDVSKKYPFSGSETINVSGGCQDDDLFNAGVNLTFQNGTLIYEISWLATDNQVPTTVNFTRTNFSVETTYLSGTLKYYFGGYCNDTSGDRSSAVRSFTARNLAPTVSWINSSPLITGNVPVTINFSFSDPEGESGIHYIYLNNNNLSDPNITTTATGYVFNLSEGTWNVSVRGQDSFFNSTTADFLLSYNMACLLSVDGLEDKARYRTTNQSLSTSCLNGINITGCYLSINKYAEEEFNCSSDSVNLEIGSNDINVRVLANGINTTTFLRVYAKQDQAGIAAFVIMIILALIAFFGFVMGASTGIPIYGIFAGIVVGILGFYVFAFSIIAAIVLWVASVLVIFKSAW